MTNLAVRIGGIGFWAPGWPDWATARAGLLGHAEADPAALKPMPTTLPSAERRRAPTPVLLACEIAAQACAASGLAAETLPSVFVSTHGDLVITDYMCSTLASAPRELSPIRFHNSVHNAPAGYWTIAAHCHAASTSISSWHTSFAAALFEAAVQASADNVPVLLAAYDAESPGPLAEVSPSRTLFGVALVVLPSGDGPQTLRLSMNPAADEGRTEAAAVALPPAFAAMAADNPMAAQSLSLLAALAAGTSASLRLPAGRHAILGLELEP